jgi:hypothetical protein
MERLADQRRPFKTYYCITNAFYISSFFYGAFSNMETQETV